MSTVYDYTFYQPARLNDDQTDQSQRTLQNSQYATYMLDQFRPACPMRSAVDFATSQININFTGSKQVGIGGCNIDENSLLSITDMTKPRCRISLMQRPFVTVPYLGRGRSDVILEAQMQQGDLANNRKSINPSSEVSYIQYSNTPMIASLQATVSNPANLIESEAADGWIRGGLASRELAKDKGYKKQ